MRVHPARDPQGEWGHNEATEKLITPQSFCVPACVTPGSTACGIALLIPNMAGGRHLSAINATTVALVGAGSFLLLAARLRRKKTQNDVWPSCW